MIFCFSSFFKTEDMKNQMKLCFGSHMDAAGVGKKGKTIQIV